ncbi:hemerythrin domain-containing protein [Pelagibius litoralis]|uniref:Hemerythrin domain-containing protein n=1 Tax=Pelagibius litoralis TaxID=374515 RepID=A0A967KB37_9PROT|nr:hemerythrin domain-containing protein [Pelagibius litoralis]NIA70169.1 hemerythrin domain-containing protein [Pelagibius litoralis]
MAGVIESLRSDHSRMTKLLDALERQLSSFDEGKPVDFDILDGVIYYCLSYPDLHHHPLEDLVFDRLKLRNPEALAGTKDLREEHEALAIHTRRFAAAIRTVQQDIPVERKSVQEVASEFLSAYRRHIMMEEKLFFPAAQRSLKPEDWSTIAGQLKPIEDPLFERREDERFSALYEDIIAWDQASTA